MLIADTATWVVAAATLGLFVATGLLFWATYKMVKTSGAQVAIEQRRLAAGQRPEVYPVTLGQWVRGESPYAIEDRRWRVLPLSNAGPGIAHNVTGVLRFADGVFVPVVPLTIQPGERIDASLDWGGNPRIDGWDDAHCFIVYSDVVGEIWLTEFYIRTSNEGRFFDYETSGPLASFGNLFTRYGILPGAIYGEPNRPLGRALALSSS